MTRTILSLCDFTGEWPRPYREAGYDVIQVDIKLGGRWNGDVLDLARHTDELPPIHGVLAAPPCTDFSYVGRAWFEQKDADGRTAHSVAIVEACMSIIHAVRPKWWALENPVGRIGELCGMGAVQFKFHPCDFGDPYKKRTWLWGDFIPLLPLFVGELTAVAPHPPKWFRKDGRPVCWVDAQPNKGEKRRSRRSATPPGFANAFFKANP